MTRRDLPQSRVEGIVATPHTSESPTGPVIERLGAVLTLESVVGGVALVRGEASSVILRPGDLLVRHGGSDRHEFPEGVHLVRVAISSRLVLGPDDADSELFDVVPRSSMTDLLVRLLQSVLAVTESTGESSPRIDGQVEQALMALAQPLVVDVLEQREASDPVARSVRARAESYIVDHHARASLSPEDIAAGLGISRRWLFRAFEGRTQTLAQTIKRIRVASATRALVADRNTTVLELARRSGFSTGDQLRRAFRAHHGMGVAAFRATLDASRHG